MNNFIKWNPVSPAPKDLYFVNLTDNGGAIDIHLAEMKDDRILILKFKGVMSYQVTDEGARSWSLYKDPSYRGLVVSDKSNYLDWFHRESQEMFIDWDLKHYSVGNVNNIIDIISGDEIEAAWQVEV
ncbi:hypothetical protein OHD16_05970 [Sphingobacterium sp. ML3W]|uniref:hypothetical protein n=1 Tax=Sphingobacterium sp. ML3W TaxID=1538644 RepID=UPI00249A2042|nr:hypothetical protein [Sphingobacterium sp. ML3W]WFA79513.1 hypothetical protein OGI71_26210 [Sphingobacterium sp. ML3W]